MFDTPILCCVQRAATFLLCERFRTPIHGSTLQEKVSNTLFCSRAPPPSDYLDITHVINGTGLPPPGTLHIASDQSLEGRKEGLGTRLPHQLWMTDYKIGTAIYTHVLTSIVDKNIRAMSKLF